MKNKELPPLVRVALYIRVSGEEQKIKGLSLAGAGNDGSMCNFTVKYNVNSFPANISFILGD